MQLFLKQVRYGKIVCTFLHFCFILSWFWIVQFFSWNNVDPVFLVPHSPACSRGRVGIARLVFVDLGLRECEVPSKCITFLATRKIVIRYSYIRDCMGKESLPYHPLYYFIGNEVTNYPSYHFRHKLEEFLPTHYPLVSS